MRKIQNKLENSSEILIDEAPMIALELVKIIKNTKTKGYAKGKAISIFFRIIERGHSDKKIAHQIHETRKEYTS